MSASESPKLIMDSKHPSAGLLLAGEDNAATKVKITATARAIFSRRRLGGVSSRMPLIFTTLIYCHVSMEGCV